jgi:hypothetical protein
MNPAIKSGTKEGTSGEIWLLSNLMANSAIRAGVIGMGIGGTVYTASTVLSGGRFNIKEFAAASLSGGITAAFIEVTACKIGGLIVLNVIVSGIQGPSLAYWKGEEYDIWTDGLGDLITGTITGIFSVGLNGEAAKGILNSAIRGGLATHHGQLARTYIGEEVIGNLKELKDWYQEQVNQLVPEDISGG